MIKEQDDPALLNHPEGYFRDILKVISKQKNRKGINYDFIKIF